jgi:hypothetical protein
MERGAAPLFPQEETKRVKQKARATESSTKARQLGAPTEPPKGPPLEEVAVSKAKASTQAHHRAAGASLHREGKRPRAREEMRAQTDEESSTSAQLSLATRE